MSGPPTSPRRRRFVVAAMLLPVALLVLVEATLRIAGVGASRPLALRFLSPEGGYADGPDGPFVRDPVLFWRLKAGWAQDGKGARSPASGFRTAFEKTKAAGVRRVACLGSSITFGLSVPEKRTWPALVGAALALERPTERWEALNLAVPGYTSWQMRRLLETEVEAMAPDVVIVEAGAFNDWVPALGPTDREQAGAPPWTRLRIVDLLADLRDAPPPPGVDAARARIEELKTADFAGERRVAPAAFEEDLRAIVAWCAARGVRAALLAAPLPARTVERNPVVLEYAETTRRVAASAGAVLVDGWAALRASGLPDEAVFFDFCHLNERGHELVAHAVGQALGEGR